jgi:hypothetical protein
MMGFMKVIVAVTHQAARDFARARGFGPRDWIYATAPGAPLRGRILGTGDHIFVLPGAETRADYKQIEAEIIAASALGDGGHVFEYVHDWGRRAADPAPDLSDRDAVEKWLAS